MTREEYCLTTCPQRFNSECFTDCDLDHEEREEMMRDRLDEDDNGGEFDEDNDDF
jgi:hypothetical protein